MGSTAFERQVSFQRGFRVRLERKLNPLFHCTFWRFPHLLWSLCVFGLNIRKNIKRSIRLALLVVFVPGALLVLLCLINVQCRLAAFNFSNLNLLYKVVSNPLLLFSPLVLPFPFFKFDCLLQIFTKWKSEKQVFLHWVERSLKFELLTPDIPPFIREYNQRFVKSAEHVSSLRTLSVCKPDKFKRLHN